MKRKMYSKTSFNPFNIIVPLPRGFRGEKKRETRTSAEGNEGKLLAAVWQTILLFDDMQRKILYLLGFSNICSGSEKTFLRYLMIIAKGQKNISSSDQIGDEIAAQTVAKSKKVGRRFEGLACELSQIVMGLC